MPFLYACQPICLVHSDSRDQHKRIYLVYRRLLSSDSARLAYRALFWIVDLWCGGCRISERLSGHKITAGLIVRPDLNGSQLRGVERISGEPDIIFSAHFTKVRALVLVKRPEG
jgi:hypothetical protein